MSSRNTLLEPEIRKNAGVIYRTISAAASMIDQKDIPELKNFVELQINSVPGFSLEYFEIADERELIPVTLKSDMKSDRSYYACIAVKAGKVRLIDNVEIRLV